MVAAIIIYLTILLFSIVFFKLFEKKSIIPKERFSNYTLAGKNQSFFSVYFSLISAMIGASATLGTADKVVQIGFFAFWWLCIGGIALILQGVFISEKIKQIDAHTLADLASKVLCKKIGKLIAFIIAVSWVGIIAAQFVSLSKLLSVITNENYRKILFIVVLFTIVFTVIGGQSGIIKSNIFQGLIIFVATIGVAIWCVLKNKGFVNFNLDLCGNKSINFKSITVLFFITGGTYFLGPDIISRTLIAKDNFTAKKASFFAGISLIIFSVLITFISICGVGFMNLKQVDLSNNPLLYLIKNEIPFALGLILCLALFSALISSVEICLVNAATIIEHDLLSRDKVLEVKIIIVFLAIFALILAFFNTDIIDLMLKAYSVYSPAVVFPLLIGIFTYESKKYTPNNSIILFSMIICAFVGVFYPLMAMLVSLTLSVLSILIKSRN